MFAAVSRVFERAPAGEGEWSIELDAQATTDAHLELLGHYGFLRISVGVQDLDRKVQLEIGRVQSLARIVEVIRRCRALGVATSFDARLRAKQSAAAASRFSATV